MKKIVCEILVMVLIIAMVDEHHAGLLPEARQPLQQTVLVRVTGGALQGGDLRVDGDFFAEELDFLRTVLEFSAQAAFRLVTHKEDHAFRPPEIVLQMVPDPACFAHAAGRDDHLGPVVEIDLLGFFRRNGQGHTGRPDGIDTCLDDLHGLLIQAA